MLQMRKGLKLPVSLRAPLAKGFRVFEHPFRDSRQKLRLRGKDFRCQPTHLTGGLNYGKVDVCGEVLFAGVCQNVVGGVMAEIGT